ncbi:delta(8)-fatty-acid desaturase 2-like [Dendrobium catenatum]|uniref:delta(8)-fatty-acid desaturase 2-like n=1 Tax=Dendrobium catenatum TaxID=906689 RepID=UPI0009F4B1D4|nr:delta(8)-fatty-acid desaturase 2-like [Dendrobium catenatum]
MATETTRKKHITLEELREHSSPSDLWISIHDKVYDLTHWIRDHPGGGIPLLNLAGQDATDPFTTLHPPSAWKHLDRFFIGYHLSDNQISDLSKDYQLLISDFTKLGLFEQKGHVILVTLCIIFALFSIAVFFVIGTTSLCAHVAAGILIGFIWTQSGWVAHDTGHATVMLTPWLNRITQLLCGNCLTGVSIGWWKRTHNAHHVACNSLDFDPDLQHIPIFAISSKFFNTLTSYFYERKMRYDTIAKTLISHQHWTFYPVMCFARLNLFAQSIVLLLWNKNVPNRFQEILGVMVFWVWYSYLVSFLPNYGERLLFVGACFVVTGIQHVLFCLSHFSTRVYVGQPQGNEWCKVQATGSLNIRCFPWMDWFYGGIQFQVEHHLFPRLPRCHLRRIAPLVRELCKKHKLQYPSIGFCEANRRTLATLKDIALQARNMEVSGARNLVWDALNTYG